MQTEEKEIEVPTDEATAPVDSAAPVGAQLVAPAAAIPTEATALEDQATPPADKEPAATPVPPLTDADVMAHTASLWKYLPLPADEPENAPQYLREYREFAGGRIIGARVRGKKHKHEGTNCDDWLEVDHCGDMALLVVADGAGSKHYSRIGARVSCQAAQAALKSGLSTLTAQSPDLRRQLAEKLESEVFQHACGRLVQLVQQAVLSARTAVENAWQQRDRDETYRKPLGRELKLEDFAATLLLAVVVPVPWLQEQLIVSCQIGDGMIASLNTQGNFADALRLLANPDSGEFSGETEFLTSSKMQDLAELQRRTKVSRARADLVMLMTDGVADDYDPPSPELYGLYFDLVANKVLAPASWQLENLTPEQAKLLRATPQPVSYPWVNQPDVQVALQYEEKLLAQLELTPEELWQRPELLQLAAVGVSIRTETRADLRLQQWLDNYTRRGSFDDRTLVLLQLGEKR